MFYGVLYQGLEGDRRDEIVFGGEIGYFDGHADGVGEANFQQVEIIADELYFFPEEDEVAFFIAEDITVDAGEGIVIEPGAFGVTGDEEGQGVERIENEVGVDLVLQGFEFGLRFGDVELFHAGFVVFFFDVEEKDLINIGDEAGGDNNDQDAIDELLVIPGRFKGPHFPSFQQQGRQHPGIDDVGEKEKYDDLEIGLTVPGVFFPDEIHDPDVPFPDEKGDGDEI